MVLFNDNILTHLFGLAGKTVLITGAGRGLGLAMAEGLAAAGATVVLNDLDASRLAGAVDTLRDQGLRVQGRVFDVTRGDEVAQHVTAIEREVAPIDILVNNAGIQIRRPLEQFAEEDWDRMMDINLKSMFLMARQVAPGMIKRRAGKIINLCSMQSEVARSSIAPYAASKGGVKMLTRAMATEWGPHNIQVNGIGPGYLETEMSRPLRDDPKFDGWLRARTPAGRWGKPEELVGAAVYLASRASDYVSGQIIYVDGGMLACL